jgi:hypothetical protein
MLAKTWRLVTIVFTALSMGMALCHLLEMPAKMTYDGALWLALLQTLYGAFGTIGAFIEVGAVVIAVVLAFLVRQRPPAFGWTLLGALCLVAAHAAWWVWVAPVNATMTSLTPETLPADWMGLRDQWEYTHAARAIVQIIALGALVFSILVETPADASRDQPDSALHQSASSARVR